MDIVERLRSGDTWYVNESLQESNDRKNKERLESADEIERLRETLQKIVDYDWRWEGGGKLGKIEGFCAKIARSALQQKDSE